MGWLLFFLGGLFRFHYTFEFWHKGVLRHRLALGFISELDELGSDGRGNLMLFLTSQPRYPDSTLTISLFTPGLYHKLYSVHTS